MYPVFSGTMNSLYGGHGSTDKLNLEVSSEARVKLVLRCLLTSTRSARIEVCVSTDSMTPSNIKQYSKGFRTGNSEHFNDFSGPRRGMSGFRIVIFDSGLAGCSASILCSDLVLLGACMCCLGGGSVLKLCSDTVCARIRAVRE